MGKLLPEGRDGSLGSEDVALPRQRLRGTAAAGATPRFFQPLTSLRCLFVLDSPGLALAAGSRVGPAAASLVAPLQRSLEAEGGP